MTGAPAEWHIPWGDQEHLFCGVFIVVSFEV